MTTKFTIQQVLGAFLSSHGAHEAAGIAYQSTDRVEWLRLAELAIRTAPAWNRTDCARAVKLALDAPEVGGKGEARDFEIRREKHPVIERADDLYVGYIVEPDGSLTRAGFVSAEISRVYSSLVGAYIVRNLKLPEGESL